MPLAKIVGYCYGMRGLEVDEIRKRSKKAQDDFNKLAHYIGRLGATWSSTQAIVKGMLQVSALRQISCIRIVQAPDIQKLTMNHWEMSPYEIVRGICLESVSQNPLQHRTALHHLVELDLPSGTGVVRMGLASRNIIITRVHAELQIADKFSRDRFMEFVDDDKYIGCSKPACYFCFKWLSNHKLGYVLPASHYKIIPGCRGPDNDINASGAAVMKDMYNKICGQLGQDILDFLLNLDSGDTHAKFQYQSTEGSSRTQSRNSMAPLNQTGWLIACTQQEFRRHWNC